VGEAKRRCDKPHSRAPRDLNIVLVAKDYEPVPRADKPHIIKSIMALATHNLSACVTGFHEQHEFAEIFTPTKYPTTMIVYHYVKRDFSGYKEVEYAFHKDDFTDEEWRVIFAAAEGKRQNINGNFVSRKMN
jgi:hypothetical protein